MRTADIRIPFRTNTQGTYSFRYHADFGFGSYIGGDGPVHTSTSETVSILFPRLPLANRKIITTFQRATSGGT